MGQEIGIRELLQQINSRFDGLEHRIDRLEGRVDHLEGRIDRLEDRIESLHREMQTNFRWIVGVILVTWVTVMGSMIALANVS